VSFAAITLHVASQRVFIIVNVYFVTDTVRKLLDTPSYFKIQTILKDFAEIWDGMTPVNDAMEFHDFA
jgi:hypothetical protein